MAIIALVIGGLFVGRAIVRSNYYVGQSDGQVVVYRGLQGSVLGMSLHELSKITCTHDMDTDDPTVTLADYDNRPADCVPLEVSDLTGTAPASLDGRDPVSARRRRSTGPRPDGQPAAAVPGRSLGRPPRRSPRNRRHRHRHRHRRPVRRSPVSRRTLHRCPAIRHGQHHAAAVDDTGPTAGELSGPLMSQAAVTQTPARARPPLHRP